jgi:recombination protein RecT
MTEQPGTDLSAQIAGKQVQAGRATAFDLVKSMESEFAKALPKHVPVEQFMRTAVTELRQSPDLQQCSAESLLGAFLVAARLGLEVGGPMGEFYLTPRRIKGVPSVVPIVGYRGLLELARRSGRVGAVKAWVVYEGDVFREGANSERGPYFDFEPLPGDPSGRKEVGVIAVAKLAGGDVQHTYLTIDQVMERKGRGAAGDNGPWKTDRAAMIRKTGLRALAGDLPQSSGLALARQVDEQVQAFTPGETLDASTGELTA